MNQPNNLPGAQSLGIYHRHIGDTVLTVISDGYLQAAMGVFRGLAEGAIERHRGEGRASHRRKHGCADQGDARVAAASTLGCAPVRGWR